LAAVPLVLVHGLWDKPSVFNRLKQQLAPAGLEIFTPHLQHRLGNRPLHLLAEDLQQQLQKRYGDCQPLDVLGFSMGGVVLRCWLQLLGGNQRTNRFLSLGSPHQGTITALPWPRWLVPGIADMKPNSGLLKQLNGSPQALDGVECHSFYCLLDLMVVPSWLGVLPLGTVQQLPVWNHRQLISSAAALKPISELILFNRSNVGNN
jgi:triacylglycerol lipase